ncbi:hypothetical protein GGS26DRAFT_48163 [Hypomontagnella submonticulosa]|nr:hypothetical protein GGS26DRAFT_48163 [Hypomontagnella submonticulosa]
MDDLPSSPDPLGDDLPPPSSAHLYARRTTNNFTHTHHDFSSLSIPKSSTRKTSPAKTSPRKRTFELDVGNELSPQKILVTVEAEEALRRGINRKLFQSSSPTRSGRRRETITTTTIPLNDEIENEATPRRGRPRRTSNGTPMPRGKKRAGTPLQKAARSTRRKGDPESDASIFDSTPANSGLDSAAPKAKGRPRKTPKSISTAQAVPSSQLSNNGTKRKRGRPRKALMPEEVAILADQGAIEDTNARNSDAAQPVRDRAQNLPPSELSPIPDVPGDEEGRHEVDNGKNELVDDITREDDGTPTPANVSQSHRTRNIRRSPGSSAISNQEERSDDGDIAMDEYPTLMEPHSDVESNFDDFERDLRSGQDTLAHASDFSMIAVESLPSFQVNRSALPSDPPEFGDETNMLINQTLETLRNSIREDELLRSPAESTRNNLTTTERDQSSLLDGSLRGGGDRSLREHSSPRRQKPLPLSRQVFAGKAPHVDDSFSSIPDSVLHAATPGRLPMKPTPVVEQHEDNTPYDDSFSEIPEEILDVLEAATPKPPTRSRVSSEAGHGEAPALHDQSSPANRQTGSNFGSSRLPTPDDTSSSNAGSKRGQQDDIGPATQAHNSANPTSNSGIQSSPLIRNRPRSMDFGPTRLDQEISNAPEPSHFSPRLPSSPKAAEEPLRSLEPPPHSRPSLSPIVRVGRTLQTVMSDRSSPEGRESSLGSPFRGPANNESSRQFSQDRFEHPSTLKSPTRSNHSLTRPFGARSSFNPNTALAQSTRSNLSQAQPPAEGDIIGNVSDPFGPDIHDHSQTEALRRATYEANDRASHQGRTGFIPSVPNSTRAQPSSSDNEMSRTGDNEYQQDANQLARSQSSSVYATYGSNASHAAIANTETSDHEMTDQQEQEQGREGEGNSELLDYEEDDADIWDFEASRPTPRRPEPSRRVSQVTERLNDHPPRRTKIPSPWRRTARRLIYREEIASPSQIEIEESPQSDAEEVPLESPKRQPPPSAQSKVQETRLESTEDPTEDGERSSHPPEERNSTPQPATLKKPAVEPADMSEYSMLDRRVEDAPTTQEKPAPAKSGLFGGFNIMSFFSSPAELPKKTPEAEQADATRKPEKVVQPNFRKPPQKDTEKQPPKEPQRSLWSTGLFPSITQKESQPSPEQQSDSFSPAPVPQSMDTVQDTYATASPSPAPSPSPSPSPPPAPSMSPEPNSPEPMSPQPHQPSTPERQIYQPIEQKRNFTPQPGQSGPSLFRSGPSTSKSSAIDDGLLLPPSDDQQESSLMTDGTDYERLPPRDEPSRWDRTLSPSKSCFRSPLKPTTPGRVVAFTHSALSPNAQEPARAEKGHTGMNGNVLSQGPLLRPFSVAAHRRPSTSSHSHTRNNTAPTATAGPINSIASTSTTSVAPPPPRPPPTHALTAATALKSAPAIAPAAPKPPEATPLSQTQWSRSHWARLEELLHLRRHNLRAFLIQQQALRAPFPISSSAPLIGKEVSAQGETLILERWHLEVVDAFRREVGGWDGRELAKRLFALLVGEKRRRLAEEKGKGKEVEVLGDRMNANGANREERVGA